MGHFLTRLGVYTANPVAFDVLVVYGALWYVLKPETFEWHAVATLATWAMTLVIQRAEHRDTQAIHAKLDEILHALGDARNEITGSEWGGARGDRATATAHAQGRLAHWSCDREWLLALQTQLVTNAVGKRAHDAGDCPHSGSRQPSTEASRRRDLSELHAMGNWASRPTQGGFSRNETVPATLSLRNE